MIWKGSGGVGGEWIRSGGLRRCSFLGRRWGGLRSGCVGWCGCAVRQRGGSLRVRTAHELLISLRLLQLYLIQPPQAGDTVDEDTRKY